MDLKKNNNNVLMLVGENNSFFEIDPIEYVSIEKKNLYINSHLAKYIRHIKYLVQFSLGDWSKKLKKYDLIFCIDSTITFQVLEWINKHKSKSTKHILYFRNKFIENDKRWTLLDLQHLDMEIWSYNIHDCQKYGFKYNPQTLNYRNITSQMTSCSKKEYGAAFIGVNKNRLNDLEKIQKLLNQNKLESFFYVINAPGFKNNKCVSNKYLNYTDYLSILNQSYSVVDLISEDNKGLTFRPIEALFLKKKLITNYKEIRNYSFYCKDNIWILGDDEEENFDRFIHSPFKNVSEQIVMYYDTKEWFKRFLI